MQLPSRRSWADPSAGLISCSRACRKSARVILRLSIASVSTLTPPSGLTSLLRAQDWAARTRPSISAPEKFLVSPASSSMLTSYDSFLLSFMVLV